MLNIKRSAKPKGNYYENSTQQWLPIKNIVKGMVQLKDGRLVKIVEIMPVNFYLKSEVEQENIIYYFASYLKIAPDNLQIRVLTQRADIEEYLRRLEEFHTNEQNELCREMINGEMEFVRTLSENTAVKKRFFIVYEYSQGAMGNANAGINDVIRNFGDEVYKAQRYLSQCGLEVIEIDDDRALIDLLYSVINKNTSKYIKPGNFEGNIFDEIITNAETE